MGYVQIDRITKNVPDEASLRKAMTAAGGTPGDLMAGATAQKTGLHWTGNAEEGKFWAALTSLKKAQIKFWLIEWT